MIELGLAVSIRVVNPVVHYPILTTIWVDVETIDHPKALDQSMCIAAVLTAYQIDTVGMIFI